VTTAVPALDARGLVKSYGARTAVDGIDLVVPRGQVLALLGPNGAGKTTTVELCEGYRTPDAGTVRVLGLDPVRQGRELRPRIGVMLQGGGAYPGVRAGEMLRLVAACAADPLDVDWLVDTLGLSPVRRLPYKRLSGGQQQRLALACAIVGRPELVFLDEPTAGLDPQARRLVWDLVAALRNDGVTVLLTTHLMEEAEALADQVVIVDAGRVVASGTPAELTSTVERGSQVRLRAGAGLRLDELPDRCRAREVRPGDYVIDVLDGPVDPQVLATVTALCARQGVLVESMQVTGRSLEDVFLDLTGRELRR
jgi:ABC-2 type transport system ATP-binding protein